MPSKPLKSPEIQIAPTIYKNTSVELLVVASGLDIYHSLTKKESMPGTFSLVEMQCRHAERYERAESSISLTSGGGLGCAAASSLWIRSFQTMPRFFIRVFGLVSSERSASVSLMPAPSATLRANSCVDRSVWLCASVLTRKSAPTDEPMS